MPPRLTRVLESEEVLRTEGEEGNISRDVRSCPEIFWREVGSQKTLPITRHDLGVWPGVRRLSVWWRARGVAALSTMAHRCRGPFQGSHGPRAAPP